MNIITLVIIATTLCLNRFLFPNGRKPFEVIHKFAKKEFGNSIGEYSNYMTLKNEIIQSLKKGGTQKAEENKLETLIASEYIRLNDLIGYLPVKFAIYSILIAVLALFADKELIAQSDEIIKIMFYILAAFYFYFIFTIKCIHKQHDQMEYYSFKLMCFEEIEKNSAKEGHKKSSAEANKNKQSNSKSVQKGSHKPAR